MLVSPNLRLRETEDLAAAFPSPKTILRIKVPERTFSRKYSCIYRVSRAVQKRTAQGHLYGCARWVLQLLRGQLAGSRAILYLEPQQSTVCKLMASWAVFRGVGPIFYLPSRSK